MPLTRIIFWQPLDSPHQDDFLEAVAQGFGGEVVLAVERPFPAHLAAQGWRTPQHRLVKVVDVSSPANHASLTAHAGPDALHVFSGFFSHPLVWSAFHTLAPSRARLAIYSEAPEQPLLTGWLKRLRGRLHAARWADRIAFVLAIGGVGREFFASIGFPHDKLVPFGYAPAVPPLPAESPGARPRASGPFRFVSAGQLIRRKGVDLLVEACAALPRGGWRLDIYGAGAERAALERHAMNRGLGDMIAFRGTIPNAHLHPVLTAADCVVLPSRFDGWGMLVSEALAAGTPTICTDRCGSADLLRTVADDTEPVGEVVPPAIGPLAAALTRALTFGPPTADRRHRCHALAGAHSAAAAARSFLDAATAAPTRTPARVALSLVLA